MRIVRLAMVPMLLLATLSVRASDRTPGPATSGPIVAEGSAGAGGADGLRFADRETLALLNTEEGSELARMVDAATAAASVSVSVPATVRRGNVVEISVVDAPLSEPLNSSCILVLPVNSSAYKEVIVFSRKYAALGVSGHGCSILVPNYIQFEGTAIVIVTVEGAGAGVATFNVTP